MNTGRFEAILQFIGVLGLIGSLIFVGFELKQSRDIALADIYQQRSAMWLEMQLSRLPAEQYRVAYDKVQRDPRELTAEDVSIFEDMFYAKLTLYENLHFQHQLDLITEEEWAAAVANIRSDFSLPCRSRWWLEDRHNWRTSFADSVDRFVANLEMPACPLDAQTP